MLKATSFPEAKLPTNAEAERYLVYEICTWLSNQAYLRLGADAYASEPICTEGEVLAALRAALEDHGGSYAGHQLANTLVRCDCLNHAVTKRLAPWDRLMFEWSARGLTAASISARLEGAGLPPLTPEATARIAADISRPAVALRRSTTPLPIHLFDSLLVVGSLVDYGFCPRHDDLFSALCRLTRPPLIVGDVQQRATQNPEQPVPEMMELVMVGTDQRIVAPVHRISGQWLVTFTHDHVQRAFSAEQRGTWMDDGAVLRGFNAFAQKLGRTERARRFAGFDGWPVGFFVVADAQRIAAFCNDLGLPLCPMIGD